MTVNEATEVVREWAADTVAEYPDVRGAYLVGSLNTLAPDGEMPQSSDANVRVIEVPRGQTGVPPVWRQRALHTVGLHHGVLLRCSVTCIELSSPEAILGRLWEGQGILFGKILADPEGALAAARRSLVSRFAQRRWIAARCEVAVNTALTCLRHLDHLRGSVLEWASDLVAWSVFYLAAACATAALRDPGGRKGLVVAREVLADAGLPDLHERLLAAFGVDLLNRARVVDLYRESLELCERAVAVAVSRTGLPGYEQIQPDCRAYVASGAAELIDQGSYREAMWRVHRTYLAAARILMTRAPARDKPRYVEMWHAVRRDLGLGSEEQVRARSASIRALSKDVLAATSAIAGHRA